MLDTGSDVSLIKISVINEMGIPVKQSSKIPPLQGITGKQIRVLGQAYVTIASNSNHPIIAQVAVVPDEYLKTHVLLGMNTIGQSTLTLDRQAKRIHWNNLVYPLVFVETPYGKVRMVRKEPQSPSHNQRFGRVTTKTLVDCYETTLVEVKVSEEPNTVIMIEAKHACVQDGLPTIMRVTETRTVFIPVINNTKVRLVLRPGTLLIKYEIIDEGQIEIEDSPLTIAKISEAIGPENDCVPTNQTRWEKLKVILDSRDWSHLEKEQELSLFRLIQKHQKLFIVHPGELGLIQADPAHIQVDDPTPCRTPLYRYPEKARETIQQILHDLEATSDPLLGKETATVGGGWNVREEGPPESSPHRIRPWRGLRWPLYSAPVRLD
ncbi:uncharacterized protein LOC123513132 [Portunus trituberculatus]|uniref:uncharacterized protein LOC123513132 n=1 Tax=Portunus trituberculatus TaxID=210409 RepID=UPI001E1CDDED|nr:uncharacterized protein LOC123513132 [Portunus trituberculatus]